MTSVKAMGAESLSVLLPSCPGFLLQRPIVGLDPALLLLQPLLELGLLLADDGLPRVHSRALDRFRQPFRQLHKLKERVSAVSLW
jgi:hypothetical protein